MAWSVNEGWDHLQGENTVLHGHGCGWRCATRVRVSDSAKILGTCQYHLESDKGAGYLTRQKKKDKGVQVTMWIYPQDRGRADPAKMVDRSIPLPLSSQHADHTFLSLILNRQLGPIPKSRDSPNLYLVPKLNTCLHVAGSSCGQIRQHPRSDSGGCRSSTTMVGNFSTISLPHAPPQPSQPTTAGFPLGPQTPVKHHLET